MSWIQYYEGEKAMSSFWWKASEADWGWSGLSLWKRLLSVTHHLTWGMQMTFYLELFRQCLPKAQADVILNLLGHYDIVDQIFAVCCDTTSSNTGVFSGAVLWLCTILNIPLPSCGFSAGGTCWQATSLTLLGPSLERRPRPSEGAVRQTSEGLANSKDWDWWNRRAR